MFKPLQKMFKTLFSSRYEEIKTYKNAYNALVTKFETLLKQISTCLQDQQKPLHAFEKDGPLPAEGFAEYLHLNTFSLLAIKDELADITVECENLFNRVSLKYSSHASSETTVDNLLNQLQDLRKYSEQIEGVLDEFEAKLLQMEEALSANSLWN